MAEKEKEERERGVFFDTTYSITTYMDEGRESSVLQEKKRKK